MSDEWSFIDTKNGKAKVWWQSKLHPEDKAKAQQLADAIDAPIWLALSTLMGREPLPDKRFLGVYWGGDERLDIALVDLSRSVTSGLNYMQCDANPAHIQFNRTKNADELAHEMMHAIQLSYDVVRGCPATDYRWLMESTAEWVKDYVYPSMQGEHPFAPRYLDQPQLPLNTKNDDHEYGAYLFSFYLARRYNQPQLIRAMWDNTTRFGSLEAVDAAIPGGFKDRWPEFALYNWNALPGPYDSYQRWDQLSHRAMPETGWAFPVVLNGGPGARIKLAEDVAHLSTKYYHFAFPEDAARTVTFYNGFDYKLSQQALITGKFDAETLMWEPVDESVKRGGNIRALIKIGGKWQLQDWTNQPYRSFCRDRSDERIEEMVLIFSNSVYDPAYVLEPQGLPSTLTVSNIGCWRYQGQSSYKGTLKTWMGVELQMTGETSTQDAIWERQPLQVMEDGSGASYIGPSTFAPVAGTIYTDWTSTGDCGNLGSGSARRQGSGAVSPGNGLNALEVLSHSVGGVDHRGYAGEASSDTMVPQSRTGCLASLPEEEAIGEWFLVRSSWQDRVGPDGKVISGSHTNTSELGTLYYTWRLTALRQP